MTDESKKVTWPTEPPTDVAGYDPTRNAGDFTFDPIESEKVVRFFHEYLQHVEGTKSGDSFTLEPWQVDFVVTLLAWKRKDGTRRYRETFVGIPRKNGKTSLAAGLAIYLLVCEAEPGAQIYCGAASKDQASLVFGIAAKMVERKPDLAGQAEVIPSRKRIIWQGDSYIRAIPAEVPQNHGFNASAVIIDELHTQPNRDLYDVLKTSMASRRQPLCISITTAGFDQESICFELWDYSKKVRDGVIDDPHFLPVIYEMEAADAWDDPATWRKCNPNYGVSVSPDYLEEYAERAKRQPSIENTFRNLHLDQWTASETRWIGSEAWNKCEVDEFPDLDGCECYVGVDLASIRDLSAVVYVFPLDGKFYVVPHFFCPSDTGRDAPKKYQKQYFRWMEAGFLTETPGAVTDYKFIRDRIVKDAERYDVREILCDPWNAQDTMTQLEDEGLEVIQVKQNWQGMSPGTKSLEEAILEGQLQHDGNPVMSWMIANTIVDTDLNSNIRPNKKKSQGKDLTKGKIDGVVAMIMAMGRAASDDAGGTVYDNRGVIQL